MSASKKGWERKKKGQRESTPEDDHFMGRVGARQFLMGVK